ncbi:MAG TPA: hypothetical protein VMN60_06880 [Longimicrobiales bacterium]|nr:hypothetical protein [Longimicrobiales bacterium]
MLRRSLLLLIIASTGCVTNPAPDTPVPAAATAFDPVGTYDFSVEIMGQTQTGEMRITRTEGQLAGSLTASGERVDLRNVKLDGRKMTATAIGPEGGPEVQFTFNFTEDDRFTGVLTVPGMGEAQISGARQKSDA